MPRLNLFIAISLLASVSLFTASCSSTKEIKTVRYYEPAYRSAPNETVYSRVMWAHPPHPIKPRIKSNAPLLLPNFKFELPDSTFEEAVESLAQALGYRWDYPSRLAKKKIKINMEGNAVEVLAEINNQAKTKLILDHSSRMLRLVSNEPTLPTR